ncbi:putative exosome complex component RRP42 [Monocercomonoides exilis]|uniref:putative exosome complex component RRP42 n=1 Tax=Monocercomonoides exilis TaxID=2049356 RepID=UPI00355A1919|nr:putative exosome complex component RRP42 [Monocercomonoides exilis]|eukprot:MONOS_8039.1-p1 / transcript=MONOS_8039.1 / gene=MONOS_8039 / organism=Monocercomonoides_exilis_PA203 / gene_product=unspecified product / transcript_product=unspecified product / location=Mono_scaffold00292:19679-20779(-) / protein_length=366 / sequence_SO=supercontig / SO=protein_coding / is_pseudo=false
MDILSPGEQIYIKNGLLQGCRTDGRFPMEFRPILVETNVLDQCLGSSKVRIGTRLEGTEAIVGIKGIFEPINPELIEKIDEHVVVYPEVEVFVNFAPGVDLTSLVPTSRIQLTEKRYFTHLKNDNASGSNDGSEAAEPQVNVTDNLISDQGTVIGAVASEKPHEDIFSDYFTKLFNPACLGSSSDSKSSMFYPLSVSNCKPGKWKLSVDVVIVEYHGSLLDCISMACRSAFSTTQLPFIDSEEVYMSDFISVKNLPLTTTCYMMPATTRSSESASASLISKTNSSDLFFDVTPEEEACLPCRVVISASGDGTIRQMAKEGSKGEEPPISLSDLMQVRTSALAAINQVIELVDGMVKKNQQNKNSSE